MRAVDSSGCDGAPVLGRLCCFGCSLSDGERERFLLDSDSGIAGVFLVQGSIKIQIWCGERRPVVTEKYTRGSLGADRQVNMGVWG